MTFTCTVVDKNGKILSDEELQKKPICIPAYYDIVLPARRRIYASCFSEDVTQKASFEVMG